MTKTDDGNADPATRQRKTTSSTAGYRWRCPFCGKSRTNRSNGEAGEGNAIAALRTHVVASDGGGHGSRNELPDDGPLVLEEHVVEVDDRSSFGRSLEG